MKRLTWLDDRTRGVLEKYKRLFQHAPTFEDLANNTSDPKTTRSLYEFYKLAKTELSEVINTLFAKNLLTPNSKLSAEYTITGHALTYTSLEQKTPGVLGSMLVRSHDPDLPDMIRKINPNATDEEIIAISKKGDILALDQNDHIDENMVVFASCIPRALDHAILKYDRSRADELWEIAQKKEVKEEGIISFDDYLQLVNIAIEVGIIPSPLIRGQYFGSGEMMPKEGDLEKGLELFRQRRRELPYKDETLLGEALSEPYKHFCIERVFEFFDIFVTGQRMTLDQADIVTHSGVFDTGKSYGRLLENPHNLTVERTKTKADRGAFFTMKFDIETDDDDTPTYSFLNDPLKVQQIVEANQDVVQRVKEASVDKLIKDSHEGAIIPAQFLGYIEKEGELFPYSPTLDELIEESSEPSLILGTVGEGKSMATVDIHNRLQEQGKYIPLLITAEDINSGLRNKLQDDTQENDDLILNLLSSRISSLPDGLLQDFRTDSGKSQFVFIIDALDEIHNYKDNVMHIIRNELPRYGNVIATSRFDGFDSHNNLGFRTYHIDPNSANRNLKEYISSRIKDKEKKEDLENLLRTLNYRGKLNYLLAYFITRMQNEGTLQYDKSYYRINETDVLFEGIKLILCDYEQTKKGSMQQEPIRHGGQTEKQFAETMESYSKEKEEFLEPRLRVLARIAAYMTINKKDSIKRDELINLMRNGWDLNYFVKEYLGEKHPKNSKKSDIPLESILGDVDPILYEEDDIFRFRNHNFKEILAAKQFAYEIQEGELDIITANGLFLSTSRQDPEEWKAAGMDPPFSEPIYFNCLRDYARPALIHLFNMLDNSNAENLIKELVYSDNALVFEISHGYLDNADDNITGIAVDMLLSNCRKISEESANAVTKVLMVKYLCEGKEGHKHFSDAINIYTGAIRCGNRISRGPLSYFEAIERELGSKIPVGMSGKPNEKERKSRYYELKTRAIMQVYGRSYNIERLSEEALRVCTEGIEKCEDLKTKGMLTYLSHLIEADRGNFTPLLSILDTAASGNQSFDLMEIGEILRRADLLNEAIKAYKGVVNIESGSLLIMDCFPDKEIRDKTIDDLDLKQRTIEAYCRIGRCYDDLEDLESAEKAYRSALEVKETSYLAHAGLASILRRSRRYEEATEHYLKALGFTPAKEIRDCEYNATYVDFLLALRDQGIKNPNREIHRLAAEHKIKIMAPPL